MIKQIASQWRSVNWQLLAVSVVIQLITWWYVPISYAAKISTSTFQTHLVFLFLYTVVVAGSTHLLLNSEFTSRFVLLLIIASFVLAFSGIERPVLLALLLLVPAFLLVLYFPWLQMQNEFGLLVFSLMETICIPATIFFFTAHFLSWSFIWTLIPMWLSYMFFQLPSFAEDGSGLFRIISTILGVILIGAVLFDSISMIHIVAIILVVASWLVMVNFPNMRDKFVKFSFFQLIFILLIYI